MTGVSERVGFFPDIAEADYHGDRDSLSVSGAKVILKAPVLYKWQLDNPPPPRDTFDFGHVAHRLVLGKGDEIAVIDADSWRTNAAKEAREEARAAHRVPILTADYDTSKAMADAIAAHDFATRLLTDGEAEVSAYAIDQDTGTLRRGRFDWLANLNGEVIGVDYKTTADVSPDAFGRAVITYSYDMQADWYSDLAALLERPLAAFCFIAQAKEPPYLVEVYDLDPALLQRGRNRNRRALDTFARCRATGRWPGHTGRDFTTLPAPRWLREDTA